MSPSARDRRRSREARRRRREDAVALDADAARRARYRTKQRRRVVAYALMSGGVVVGLQHFGFHLVGSPSGLSDLLVGYPTAGLLFVSGAIALGP